MVKTKSRHSQLTLAGFVLALFASIITGTICMSLAHKWYDDLRVYYETLLNDPHHCVSICNDMFEEYGC